MLDERTALLYILKDAVEKIQSHEETLRHIVEELTQASPLTGEMVKDEEIYESVTVRSQHRVTLKMVPEGSVCHLHIYRSKRPRSCSCGGKEDCPLCEGEGQYYPVTGVLLERVT